MLFRSKGKREAEKKQPRVPLPASYSVKEGEKKKNPVVAVNPVL